MTTNAFTQRLTDFLCDDEDMTKDQIRIDLQEKGVDIDAFMMQIHTTIRKTGQEHKKLIAQKEIEQAKAEASDLSQKVLAFPIEKIRHIVEEAESGSFGVIGKDLAIACRQKKDQEPTDDELRALVQDILETSDQEPDL